MKVLRDLELGSDRTASGLAGIRAEELEATTLWATIKDTPAAKQLDLILGDSRDHTWTLAEPT